MGKNLKTLLVLESEVGEGSEVGQTAFSHFAAVLEVQAQEPCWASAWEPERESSRQIREAGKCSVTGHGERDAESKPHTEDS